MAIRARILVFCSLMFSLLDSGMAYAQSNSLSCVILGKVVDEGTNLPIPFAVIRLQGTEKGTSTDLEGQFRLEGVAPGVHNIEVSFLGYGMKTIYEIETTPSRPAMVNVSLAETAVSTDEAVVVAESRATVEEAPLSVRSIGTNEIKRNPGGGRDISRALRSLQGLPPFLVFEMTL